MMEGSIGQILFYVFREKNTAFTRRKPRESRYLGISAFMRGLWNERTFFMALSIWVFERGQQQVDIS